MEIWKWIFFWKICISGSSKSLFRLSKSVYSPKTTQIFPWKQFLEAEKQHHKMKLPRNDPLMVGTSDSWLSLDDVERVNHISTQGKVPPFAYNRLHTNTPWYTISFPNANVYSRMHASSTYFSYIYHLLSKDIAAPQKFFVGAWTEPRCIINSRGT